MNQQKADAIILGCVSEKAQGPRPAKDLYVSPLFQKRRRYAEAAGLPWVIFSAEHGIVTPTTVLDWYDVALKQLPPREQRAKGEQAAEQLERIFGPLEGKVFEIHAGAAYRQALEAPLARRGASLLNRIEGLRFGEQLQWYDRTAASDEPLRHGDPGGRPARPAEQIPARPIHDVSIRSTRPTGAFDFRWPEGIEHFDRGWDMEVHAAGQRFRVRHGIGKRPAYGRERVHSVTWVNGQPRVEGVEADDYEDTGGLVSVLKIGGRSHVRDRSEIPAGYEGFPIVRHDHEIDAPYTRRSLAVKIAADDLAGWARHALLRTWSREVAAPSPVRPPTPVVQPQPAQPLPPPVPFKRQAVVDALLQFGATPEDAPTTDPQFTPDPDANRLVIADPFAFLLAVIFDQGVVAERAWAAPYELRRRLGHLDPYRMANELREIEAAVQTVPKLHRYVEKMPRWLHAAAVRVIQHYEGDAGRIWDDRPSAQLLQARLDAFQGIGQKKAAMAVEILERDLGVEIRELQGSDIAYDVHVRRVLLRVGLAERDDLDHMLEVSRAANPERPGAIDLPAWRIGREWCRPGIPDCPACPLETVCPKLVDRAAAVRGA